MKFKFDDLNAMHNLCTCINLLLDLKFGNNCKSALSSFLLLLFYFGYACIAYS